MKSVLLGYVIEKEKLGKKEVLRDSSDGKWWSDSPKEYFESLELAHKILKSHEFTHCPVFENGTEFRKPSMLNEGQFTIKILPVIIYSGDDMFDIPKMELKYEVIKWSEDVIVSQFMKIKVTHIKIVIDGVVQFDSSKGKPFV